MDQVNTAGRVIVTGGASGIGLAAATAFLDRGAQVGIVSRTQRSIEKALDGPLGSYAGRVHAAVADVADDGETAAAIDELGSALGGVGAVGASAGIEGEMGAGIGEVTSAGFRRVLDVNVLGVFHLVKHALPYLVREEHASVTIIGSDSGFVATPGMLAYNASKGALVQLTRALSVELYDQHGIRVNSVCPSIVGTPMARRGVGVETFDEVPYPVNSAEDVAQSVVFLSSSSSRGINGVNLLSDFGFSARSSFPA
ncbi:SDR family oxidoreductase [Arthrobacter deserti]|uniref:SDR family oxidoreductase n=1 Tax=Arthrobacter deserti TaxID=1742687 RepID=A0ABX1JIL8_9MICC|nr:SDR family oxidoreductase [Arthrobacter deserti]